MADNLGLLTAGATLQLLFGSAMIVLAATLGRYLGTEGLLDRVAMIGGVVGGAAFIAAGAILQETVFYGVFVDSRQAAELAAATGASDLTALNLAISVVAGGDAVGRQLCIRPDVDRLGCRWRPDGQLPRLLSTVGIVAGLGFALTNWIGPFAGPFAFFGSLIWLYGLAIVLFRRARAT